MKVYAVTLRDAFELRLVSDTASKDSPDYTVETGKRTFGIMMDEPSGIAEAVRAGEIIAREEVTAVRRNRR